MGLELAKRLGGEIISADSVQVYRTLNIGSDKVRVEAAAGALGGEMAEVHRHAQRLAPCAIHQLSNCENAHYQAPCLLAPTSVQKWYSLMDTCRVMQALSWLHTSLVLSYSCQVCQLKAEVCRHCHGCTSSLLL